MSNPFSRLEEVTSLRASLLLVVFSVVGVLFLWGSAKAEESHHLLWAALSRELGSLLLVTLVLTLLWDILGKRSFADEILAKAGLSRDLNDAGIQVITESFQDPRINWDQLFSNACHLDIFVAYASTWRNSHMNQLGRLLRRQDSRLRVILPDPGNAPIVEELAARFQISADELQSRINDSISSFQQLNDGNRDNVQIYLCPVAPLYTMYRFDSSAVIAFYNHRLGRIPVPALICNEKGYLYRHVTEEIEGLIARSTRQ
jgi:hypothetical protein